MKLFHIQRRFCVKHVENALVTDWWATFKNKEVQLESLFTYVWIYLHFQEKKKVIKPELIPKLFADSCLQLKLVALWISALQPPATLVLAGMLLEITGSHIMDWRLKGGRWTVSEKWYFTWHTARVPVSVGVFICGGDLGNMSEFWGCESQLWLFLPPWDLIQSDVSAASLQN